jgi:NAD(P)H-nitrite reductase large subunit
MNSLKHLGLPIMAVGLKQGDEVLRTRIDGGWRTLYLQENRLVGFQLIGDIRTAGTLRTLLLHSEDVRRIKDRLLEPSFGQGVIVGGALAPF